MMVFADMEHEEKYRELTAKYHAGQREYDVVAALFLLSSPLLARRCVKYVERRGIKFTELLKAAKPWSSSEKGMVKLAAALFNSSRKADVNDIFWSLDTDNIKLALEAIAIRFA